MTRRRFLALGGSGAVTLAVIACGGTGGRAASQANQTVRWISPRGTLEVLDDYAYWTAHKMGYFGDLITPITGGPIDATATVKYVDQGQEDMGYPSPGVFSLAIAQGMNLISVFNMGAYDVFDFAVPKGSPIKSVKDLAGKTILLGSAGWQSIADPLLYEGGLDPKSVKYQAAGNSWAQALAAGQGDAALSWEGLRAQWLGQGLHFDYILGMRFSKFPANSFVVRKSDFGDARRRQVLTSYLRGWAMGLEFGYRNPRAATQLTMDQFPALSKQMAPAVAVRSMLELGNVFRGDWSKRQGWGWHDEASWQAYFTALRKIGQLTQDVKLPDVISNALISGANGFDHDKVHKDADQYPVRGEYKSVDVDQIKASLLIE